MVEAASPRTALLAGATGLVGHALLPLLLDAYAAVTVLARRARPPEIPEAATLAWRRIEFEAPELAVPAANDVYIALGTTIGVAGSEAAFRRVDLDAVLAVARAARVAGASRLAVVSALGADPRSRVFYNRVKGEMEAAILDLGYTTVTIARPSLLIGDRAALGQPLRRGEVLAARLSAPLQALLPKRLRPIEAARVARAMLAATLGASTGVQRLSSADMQDTGSPT